MGFIESECGKTLKAVALCSIIVFVVIVTFVMVDKDDVMQGRLSYVPVSARSFSEGSAAVDAGNGYCFINTLRDKVINGPFAAAVFTFIILGGAK